MARRRGGPAGYRGLVHDDNRYSGDVLAPGWRDRGVVAPITVPAEPGLVIERSDDGWCGAVIRVEAGNVQLEDRRGATRVFPLGGGYLYEGRKAVLTAPGPSRPSVPARTASGSVRAPESRARVARGSRIFVEGRHDAELVEKVWGDDLRAEGVVVEYLGGIDDLPAIIREWGPEPGRRIGVLVDHLVPGSKESRIAEETMRGRGGEHVLIVGHPYVDVWQAVKPERLGMRAWPTIPRGTDWKTGIMTHLGLPTGTQADTARAWQAILGRVRNYLDLEPELLGRVEQLIDFVTAPV
ncbi:hypothetical protein FM119_09310 [Mycetocola reblochoni REB411]|uniref:DUF3097 domain-containing protein n=1 Tax=Mycetocola reblochoni REB411 TaxID=1255698 RepID=A0A1R4JT05_9MICO|nr:hypothetical protein FM119_09310 [Mycetocola reblochoni REB411]